MSSRPRHHSPSTRRLATGGAIGLAGVLACGLAVGPAPVFAAPGDTAWSGPAVVTDTFERSSSSGWAAAELGGSYRTPSASSFAVADGRGTISIGATGSSRAAAIQGASIADVTAGVDIGAPAVPASGNGVYTGLQLRGSGSAYYQASARFTPAGDVLVSMHRVVESTSTQERLTGEVTVASGVEPGDRVRLEAFAHGSDRVELGVRAAVGDATPSGWAATATDDGDRRLSGAGTVGLWAYLSSKSPADSSTLVAFDELGATDDGATAGDGDGTGTDPAGPDAEKDAAGQDAGTAPETDGAGAKPDTGAPDAQPADAEEDEAPVDGEAADDEPARPGAAAGDAGAAPVGEAAYDAPADAVYVDDTARGGGDGSEARPVRSIADAIRIAPAGGTVVLREGVYRDSVEVRESKPVTIQNAAGEEVWLDGTDPIDDWTKRGSTWSTPWTHEFDASPTFTRGEADGDNEHLQFLDPEFPMAAHPEQVWIDGEPLRQVASPGAVTAGTFAVDAAADRLVVGTDPAAGATASTRQKGVALKGAGSTLRGVGVRGFAPSVWQMGAVSVEGAGVTVENVEIRDSATIGLYAWGDDATISDVTIAENGMLGIGANTANGLRVTGSVVDGNNTERFTRKPVSGGIKVTKSSDVEVSDSSVSGNATNGIWLDESVFDARLVGNTVAGNGATGVLVEISDEVVVADSAITGSGRYGLWVGSSGDVEVWHNAIADNALAAVQFTQDERRNTAEQAAAIGQDVDEIPWVIESSTVKNNVISGGGGSCLLCVDDLTWKTTADEMGFAIDGNLYHRPADDSPETVVRWGQAERDGKLFRTVDEFAAAVGHDGDSTLASGAAVVTADGRLTDAGADALAGVTAQPLDAAVRESSSRAPESPVTGRW